MTDKYRRENRKLWDEWTEIHAQSTYYDLHSFKNGKCTLRSIELEELGEVSGKSLLHLQCHFGMDTLSWARLGAKVTGIDFSEKAIALARSLSVELNIPSKFICADIYDLADILDERFEIIFTSYGVLTWLPDLRRWGQIISQLLVPDGTFYIVEFHPFFYVFDDADDVTELHIGYPYFESSKPLEIQVQGSYADRKARVSQSISYEWLHSLGEIINSLTGTGLRIEFLHEFPYSVDPMIPSLMEKGQDGWWRLKDPEFPLPLMFSLKATK
jgi:SAM-dependent methyltransferase